MFKPPVLSTLLKPTVLLALMIPVCAAQDGKYDEDGKYFTEDDIPTYNVDQDGRVDWYTYSGFRRYHAECHVCHGPEGGGSSYAPALARSAVDMDYYDFVDAVTNGIVNVSQSSTNVMPAFGVNRNVMCYLDDIYVYLLAKADNVIPPGRPQKKQPKPQTARDFENACLDQ